MVITIWWKVDNYLQHENHDDLFEDNLFGPYLSSLFEESFVSEGSSEEKKKFRNINQLVIYLERT